MAAPTLETNAAADTLRITGGTAGNPVTWDDVWDWDDGGGSSGGDGDVPKDGGGTAKVNTFMTETVADAVYLILKHIDFGDGVAPTYFSSKNEMVYGSSGIDIKTKALATLTLGKLIGDWGYMGAMWNIDPESSVMDFCDGGTVNIYGSYFYSRADDTYIKFKTGVVDIRNSIMSFMWSQAGGTQWKRAPQFANAMTTINLRRVTFTDVNALTLFRDPDIIENIHLHKTGDGIWTQAGVGIVSVSGLLATEATRQANTFGEGINIIDSVTNLTAVSCNEAGLWIKEHYTANIHIADKDGADLVGVTVACDDQFGNPAFSVNTDASGDIAEQIITYKQWLGTSETLTEYSPHKFTIYKAGYETMVLDEITVDAPIVWHLELLPALAEADVRDGTTFGEDSEGNLELPTIGDVEAGVGFGSNGVEFTGIFGVPLEDDVEDGVGYGAGGVEFEGDLEIPVIGDVRDGIGFGADGTELIGILDLPSISDVKLHTIFDNGAKEGTYICPIPAGEMIAYLEESTEMEGYLEESTNLIGEIES